MSFRFTFSPDSDSDSDSDPDPEDPPPPSANPPSLTPPLPDNLNPPHHQSLTTLLTTLPHSISYTTITVPGPIPITLPRRELYDVRMQLMSEDSSLLPSSSTDPLISSSSDIHASIYEGGLKSWESSYDLVTYLSSIHPQLLSKTTPIKIAELGCGTALPTLFLFQKALSLSPSPSQKIHFTLTDFNYSVLRLVTLPNIFLSWVWVHSQQEQTGLFDVKQRNGDVEVTSGLKSQFLKDLQTRNISLDFISGSWGEEMISMIFSSAKEKDETPYFDLVMGSETIYSPASIPSFTKLLLGLLRPLNGNEEHGGGGKGLVAAKQIYFGVGGGIAEFLGMVEKIAGEGVWKSKMVKEVREGGVVRGVWEISR